MYFVVDEHMEFEKYNSINNVTLLLANMTGFDYEIRFRVVCIAVMHQFIHKNGTHVPIILAKNP